MAKHIITCPQCGREFTHRCESRIYCSRECYRKSRIKNLCVNCGKRIDSPCNNKSRLCKTCYTIQVKIHPELNNRWKGGRIKHPHGYVLLFKPDHPRSDHHGYVREHILVWENTHGRPLPEDWIVHHINGKRDDNRPVNLMAMPKKSHHGHLALQAAQKRIRQLEIENQQLRASVIFPAMDSSINEPKSNNAQG